MRDITKIIVHCAATYADQDIGVPEIDGWHRQRGFDCIGYHYVIRRSGKLETGRPERLMGAHCKGYNAESIGVCLVGGLGADGKGEDNFTLGQRQTLQTLLYDLTGRYPRATIHPHRQFARKECPCFDLGTFLRLIGLERLDGYGRA